MSSMTDSNKNQLFSWSHFRGAVQNPAATSLKRGVNEICLVRKQKRQMRLAAEPPSDV